MDTLDYTSGKVNEGSKSDYLGLGEATRDLPTQVHGELPGGVSAAKVFWRRCLVLQGRTYAEDAEQARVWAEPAFARWPLIRIA